MKPSSEIAGKRSKDLQIEDVQFVAIEATPVVADVPDGARLGWDLRHVEAVWRRDGAHAIAVMPFEIGLFAIVPESPIDDAKGGGKRGVLSSASGSEKKVPTGRIRLVLRVVYELRGDAWSDEDISHALGILGYLHAWPYVRSEVQYLSAKIGLPALVLPVSVAGHAEKYVTMSSPAEMVAPAPKKRRPKKRGES